MPLPVGQAYARAKRLMDLAQKSRLDSILDADPRMARFLNEYGMENAAKSEFPIAVMPPDKFLQLARRFETGGDDTQNLAGLLHRINRDQPTASRMDFWDDETTPPFLRGYMKHRPDATSSDIYGHKGLGLPAGFDMHPDVGMLGDAEDYTVDTGGLPVLKYTPRGAKAISITDHEGRGRNAFAAQNDFSMPVQMMERTAIVPDDPYLPSSDVEDILRRLGRGNADSNAEANAALNGMREPVYLGPNSSDEDPMGQGKATAFLNQITRAVPEDYIRYGINRRFEKDGPPLSVPWKVPVFAEGGAVEQPGMLQRASDWIDNLGSNAVDYWNDRAQANRAAGDTAGAENDFLARHLLSPVTFYNASNDKLQTSPLGLGQDLAGFAGQVSSGVHKLSDKMMDTPVPGAAIAGGALNAITGGINKVLGPANDAYARKTQLMEERNKGIEPNTFGERMSADLAENLPLAFMGVGTVGPEMLGKVAGKYGLQLGKGAVGAGMLGSDVAVNAGLEGGASGLEHLAKMRQEHADAVEKEATAELLRNPELYLRAARDGVSEGLHPGALALAKKYLETVPNAR